MVNIVLGKSTLLTVTFRVFSDDTDIGSPVDPVTVTGSVKDSHGNTVSTFSPLNDAVGVYSFTWTPSIAGTFTLEFIGTYLDSSQDVISEEFVVTANAQNFFFTTKLGEDQTLQFMSALALVYIDPEEILPVFPDAPLMEVVEFIRIYSQEVAEIMGPTKKDPATWEVINFEYIRAATLCALSKFYGFGDADLTQITLGDLEVTNQRFGRTTINRANAVTWCEMAGALRMELIANSGRENFRAIKKGSKFENPIPHRWLKQYEHGRF